MTNEFNSRLLQEGNELATAFSSAFNRIRRTRVDNLEEQETGRLLNQAIGIASGNHGKYSGRLDDFEEVAILALCEKVRELYREIQKRKESNW